jgi:uncharacterized caspase-like protein
MTTLRTRLVTAILLIVGMLCLNGAAAADNRALVRTKPDAAATGERRLALVIGNSAYGSAPLRNPVNDATAIARHLRELGFQVLEGTDQTYWKMMEILDQFGEQLKEGDVALFYYAGHAMQVQGQNFLIPVDVDLRSEKEARYKTVPADLVLTKMDAARSRTNVVILDACRNNPFTRSFRSQVQGLAQMDAPSGTLIAYATAPGKVASDGSGQNGLYTEALLKYLQEPGLKIEEVLKRVRAEVQQSTKGEQIPWESSSLVGDFYFKPATATATTTTQPPPATGPAPGPAPAYGTVDPKAVELSFWDSVKDSGNASLLKSYLERYPQGTFTEIAKVKLQQLETKPEPVAKPPPEPVNTAKSWFGVQVAEVPATPSRSAKSDMPAGGAKVTEVMADSPAAEAGIKTGDIIIAYNDQAVVVFSDLPRLVEKTPPGAAVTVTLLRGGKKRTVSVDIEELPEELPSDLPVEKPLGDEQMRKLLIGTWQFHSVTPEGAVLNGRTSYFPNGTAKSVGTVQFQGQQAPIVLSGTWELKKGFVYSKVKSSNVPQMIPVGFSSASKIISIDEDQLTYVSDGQTITEFRVEKGMDQMASAKGQATAGSPPSLNLSLRLMWFDDALGYQAMLQISGQAAMIVINCYDRAANAFLTTYQQQVPVIATGNGIAVQGVIPIQWDSHTQYPHTHQFNLVIQASQFGYAVQNCINNVCQPVQVQ